MIACFSTFLLGIVYYLGAIPAGVAMGLSWYSSAFFAWAGYVFIAAVVIIPGQSLRDWIVKKFKISLAPNPQKLFWRIWLRWGLIGLAILAPLTCGPYIAAILAVALGSKPANVLGWIAVGALPVTAVIAAITIAGTTAIK